MGTLPPPLPPVAPAVQAPASGRATAAMVLGIIGLAGGFLAVPLLCAVIANVLGAQALEDIEHSDGRLRGHGHAVAGIACATAALVLWLSVFVLALAFGDFE
jgi:hypothetical protein